MQRLLIVEDQKKLLGSLCRGFTEEGYGVVPASTGEDAYYHATTQPFDAIVLDLMLPGRHGLQVLRDMRTFGVLTPVLILTAKDTVEDRVRGLNDGADDYLVKPFAFAELLARVRAILRRNVPEADLILRSDTLEMDRLARRVVRSGVEIELSKREFDLLEFLLRHRNTTVTRDMISREVWKEPEGVWTNVIEVCINSLRKKVEQAGQRQLIQTIRGVGYTLRDQP